VAGFRSSSSTRSAPAGSGWVEPAARASATSSITRPLARQPTTCQARVAFTGFFERATIRHGRRRTSRPASATRNTTISSTISIASATSGHTTSSRRTPRIAIPRPTMIPPRLKSAKSSGTHQLASPGSGNSRSRRRRTRNGSHCRPTFHIRPSGASTARTRPLWRGLGPPL
jgi:hypothetical protein